MALDLNTTLIKIVLKAGLEKLTCNKINSNTAGEALTERFSGGPDFMCRTERKIKGIPVQSKHEIKFLFSNPNTKGIKLKREDESTRTHGTQSVGIG